MAEIELSILKQQCLDRRLADIDNICSETAAWQFQRNQNMLMWLGNLQPLKSTSNSNAFTHQNHDGIFTNNISSHN
jgi:hypothetical protein